MAQGSGGLAGRIGFLAAIFQLVGIGSVFELARNISNYFPEGTVSSRGLLLVVVAALSLLTTLSVIFAALFLRSREKYRPPYSIDAICHQLVVGRAGIVHTTVMSLTARSNAVRFYEGRFSWTGESQPEFKNLLPAGSNIIPTGARHPWEYFQFYFPAPLGRGESITISYDQEVPLERFDHLISKYVIDNINKLTLKILYSDGSTISSVTKSLMKTSFDDFPRIINHEAIPSNRPSALEWEIDKPKKGVCYQMTWVPT